MKHLAVFWFAAAAFAQSAGLQYDPANPQAAFAATEIRRAFAARGQSLVEHSLVENGSPQTLRLVLSASNSNALADSLGVPRPKESTPQSYAIRRLAKDGVTTLAVLAADGAGAMYGGLDLAEAIRLGTLDTLPDADHSPYIEKRGIKFNIPLDSRTPSYSDNSDAAQNNIAEMWSLDFWHEFIDEMARHRYNVLSLWSLHPFPSLVKVPEYPDVALNDVMRTKVPMDDTFSPTGSDMVRPAMLASLETLRTLTIDQKIAFWREVMQYAANRDVEVYWFTWNIFTYGAEGKYGITPEQDNPKTIAYFRASVRELVLTYPLLAGIGITAGEHMQNRKDQFASEKWLWSTYGLGILDAKRLQPARSVRLIHRYHQTAQSEILDAFQAYPDTFELSFKYAIAHMYSIPNPPFIQSALPHITAAHRTWLTVRDDDVYSFRWGNPEFARAFIRNMPGKDKVTGFYMGPDGFVWGRDFLAKDSELSAPARHLQTLVLLHAVGPPEFRSRPSRRALPQNSRHPFSRSAGRNAFHCMVRRLHGLSPNHPLLLGRYRPALVPRSLPQPPQRRQGLLHRGPFYGWRNHARQRHARHHGVAPPPARRPAAEPASPRFKSQTRLPPTPRPLCAYSRACTPSPINPRNTV